MISLPARARLAALGLALLTSCSTVHRLLSFDLVDLPEVRVKNLQALQETNVLTVSEFPPTYENSGIINFVIKDQRVRFSIDLEAAERAELRLSSKLLRLALNLEDRTQEER